MNLTTCLLFVASAGFVGYYLKRGGAPFILATAALCFFLFLIIGDLR